MTLKVPFLSIFHTISLFLLKTTLDPWKGQFFLTLPFPSCDDKLMCHLLKAVFVHFFLLVWSGLLSPCHFLAQSSLFLNLTSLNPKDGGSMFLETSEFYNKCTQCQNPQDHNLNHTSNGNKNQSIGLTISNTLHQLCRIYC
jgi:hypothetical protein